METLQILWQLMPEGIVLSICTALVLPILGGLIYLRRSAFLGVAIPQFSAAGIAGGLALLPWFPSLYESYLDHGHPPLSYLFLFAVGSAGLALLIFAWLEKNNRESSADGRMAAGFAFAGALSLIFLSYSPVAGNLVQTLQRGSVVVADWHALSIVLVVDSIVILLLMRYLRGLLLVSFDADEAVALGHRPGYYEGLFHVLVGLAIGAGVMTVGPIFVFGLIFLPPIAARRWAGSIFRFFLGCLVLAMLPTLAAWPLSFQLDLPYGPCAVVLMAVFVVFAVVSKWLWRSVRIG